MATFSEESYTTNSGTVTAWLPIPTPWLSIAACSTQIYAQRAGLGGNLIAFDPLYGESIVPSEIPCLPTEVTSSWYQSSSDTTTVLGPTFVCPGAYSAVQTILVNPLTEQVLCCPSKYSLNIAITGKGTFPSQCTSLLTSGQTLTYESTTPNGPWGIVTSTVLASTATTTGPTVVFGMHVNGFNVLPSATTISSTSGTTAAVVTPMSGTSQPTQTNSSSPSGSAGTSSSISKGAAAGIGIGVGLAVILAAIGAWILFSRSRKRIERQTYTPAMASQAFATGPQGLYEVDGGSPNSVKKIHELSSGQDVVTKRA